MTSDLVLDLWPVPERTFIYYCSLRGTGWCACSIWEPVMSLLYFCEGTGCTNCNGSETKYQGTLCAVRQDVHAHNGSLHFRQHSKSPERLPCGDAGACKKLRERSYPQNVVKVGGIPIHPWHGTAWSLFLWGIGKVDEEVLSWVNEERNTGMTIRRNKSCGKRWKVVVSIEPHGRIDWREER